MTFFGFGRVAAHHHPSEKERKKEVYTSFASRLSNHRSRIASYKNEMVWWYARTRPKEVSPDEFFRLLDNLETSLYRVGEMIIKVSPPDEYHEKEINYDTPVKLYDTCIEMRTFAEKVGWTGIKGLVCERIEIYE